MQGAVWAKTWRLKYWETNQWKAVKVVEVACGRDEEMQKSVEQSFKMKKE